MSDYTHFLVSEIPALQYDFPPEFLPLSLPQLLYKPEVKDNRFFCASADPLKEKLISETNQELPERTMLGRGFFLSIVVLWVQRRHSVIQFLFGVSSSVPV